MSNKRMKNDPLDWVGRQPQPQERPRPELQKRAERGRPRTIRREYTKSSQEGLKENWTRYTVIVREDLLERLKDQVYKDDVTMKKAINEMIEAYLDEREAEGNE